MKKNQNKGKIGSVSVGETGGNSEILTTVIVYESVEKKTGSKPHTSGMNQIKGNREGGYRREGIAGVVCAGGGHKVLVPM